MKELKRLLGITSEATPQKIKASYRRLARQYHPDVSPDGEKTKAKFIQLTDAYKLLLALVKANRGSKVTKVTEEQPSENKIVRDSEYEQKLKWNSYKHLQQLFKQGRIPRAIALIEGLAERLPQDLEVRQWQAITYHQWGRQLAARGKLERAKIYLQKALSTDPYNRSLYVEVERDLSRLGI